MIRQPLQFDEAIGFLLNKEQLPAEWNASDWRAQEPDFQTKAFFSSRVENARFLDRAQGLIFDFMAKTTEEIPQPDGSVKVALRTAGREHFVKRMRDFMIAEGMAKASDFKSVRQTDVTDIRSLSRLRLIFDTNVRQAYGYGQWHQGMRPAVLRAYPAARLIRDRGVAEPRLRHQENLGEVLLKTDPRWAEFHNDPLIGGFGVPWGPYGFKSGCTQEDVSYDEAKALGLAVDSVSPVPVSITDGTRASIRKLDPALKRKLIDELRGGPKPRSPREAAQKAARETREIMLKKGLADAQAKGDSAKTAKYQKAIANLPKMGLKVMEDGDKIVLEMPNNSANFSTDERSSHIQKETWKLGEIQEPNERAIALNVRTASTNVYPGWSVPNGDGDTGESQQRAIEAHIAAAVTGRKPLYFDPWGEQFSDAFAREYRKVLPQEVEVVSRDGMLFVFRPEKVAAIMDSDPSFYRHAGESILDSIVRVSAEGRNGELLGYGARDMVSRPAHAVRIFKGDQLMLYYFVSDPDFRHASRFAQYRADDFEKAFGWDDVSFILEKLK